MTSTNDECRLPVSRSWLVQGYLANDFGVLQNIIILAQQPESEMHLGEGAKVILPINYVMWNEITASRYWPRITELFNVSHLKLRNAASEHPLVKTDAAIEGLILKMGKSMQTSLQLLQDPTLSGRPSGRRACAKAGLSDDCVFVVLVKKT